MTIADLCEIAGAAVPTSATPPANPWSGVMHGSLARSLGFAPEIATTRQAARKGVL